MSNNATDRLRELLDERGVEYDKAATVIGGIVATFWHDRDGYPCSAIEGADDIPDGEVSVQVCVTPEQAVAATLGQEPRVDPTWERWHKSLRHDEIKSIGDAVEQLMYEAIEFGGDMGPNGNTCNGTDEGDVLTSGFINDWIARFESTLGGTYTREECEASFVRGYSLGCLPSGSDPQWDENRQTVDEHMAELGWVRKDAATLEAETCVMEYGGDVAEGTARAMDVYFCSECGSPTYNDCMPYYCIYCGKAVKR